MKTTRREFVRLLGASVGAVVGLVKLPRGKTQTERFDGHTEPVRFTDGVRYGGVYSFRMPSSIWFFSTDSKIGKGQWIKVCQESGKVLPSCGDERVGIAMNDSRNGLVMVALRGSKGE